jgi:hypothetical protein
VDCQRSGAEVGVNGDGYTIRVHAEPHEMLWAEVDELPGCFATGRDMDELAVAVAEAISMRRESDLTGINPDCDPG